MKWPERVALHRARPRVLAAVLSCLAVAPALARAPACPAEIVRCCAERPAAGAEPKQDAAFGVQIWPEDVVRSGPALASLQPAAIRYSAGPSWRRLPALPRQVDYGAARRYVADAFARETQRFAAQALSLRDFVDGGRAEAHLIVWEPPLFSPDPPAAGAKARPALAEDEIAPASLFYVALIEEMRARGYPLDVIELTNEPDGDWNLAIAPERYVRLVQQVRREAQARNIPLPRIAGPGVSRISALQAYLGNPLLASGMVGAVDSVSVHGWDERAGRDTLAEADKALTALARAGYRKPIVLSELALTFLDPTDRQTGRGANARDPQASSNRPGYAARSMALILALAAAGFSPILHWEFRDQAWGRSSYGLQDLDGRDRPLAPAWARLAALTRPGTGARVANLVNDAVYAILRQGRIAALVLLNTTDHPIALLLNAETKQRASGGGPSALDQALTCEGPDGVAIVLSPGQVLLSAFPP